jgi:hypothetical protein
VTLTFDLENQDFQIFGRTKYVPKCGQNSLKDVDSRVFTRMLRKDGSVTISLRNFIGEEIKKGAPDSQLQVISLPVACPWSAVLSRYSDFFYH